MRSVVWSLDRQRPLNDEAAQGLFTSLIEDAVTLEEPSGFEGPACMAGARKLREHANDVYSKLKKTETNLNAVRAERRRSMQEATMRSKVRAAKRSVDNLERAGRSEFPVRMARARLEAAQTRLDSFLAESVPYAGVRIEEGDVAVIHVRVG